MQEGDATWWKPPISNEIVWCKGRASWIHPSTTSSFKRSEGGFIKCLVYFYLTAHQEGGVAAGQSGAATA